MTADEVRQKLRDIVWEFAPRLAASVLDRRDFDYTQQLATRIDAAMQLLERFNKEVEETPDDDGIVILKRLDGKLATEKATLPEEVKGPSIWELIQKPVL